MGDRLTLVTNITSNELSSQRENIAKNYSQIWSNELIECSRRYWNDNECRLQ